MPSLPRGYTLSAFEDIDSTNEEAKRQAAAGAADRTVVWARSQHAGRGRRGRGWSSPGGNLYVSFILRPGVGPGAAAQLSFVMAVALYHALRDETGPRLDLALKWPNDVLIEGRKVSGILLESAMGAGGAVEWLVIGVGINLASHPQDAAYPAGDLSEFLASPITPDAMLEALVLAFESWMTRWRDEGFAPIRAEWLAHACGRGEVVTARLPERAVDGIFRDLDDNGALILERPGGQSERISAGDIFFPPRG